MNHSTANFLQLTSVGWFMMMLYWLYAGLQTKMTVKREHGLSRLAYLLLLLPSFGLIYFRYFQRGFLALPFLVPTDFTNYGGLLIHAAGISFAIMARSRLGRNWSATVTVKRDHELITTGPYAVTRHPIYTGIFFGLVGAVLILGELRGLIALVMAFTAMQMKMSKEEIFMRAVFPEYDSYRRRTRKMIPFIY